MIKTFAEYIAERRAVGINDMQQHKYEDVLKSAVWDYVSGYTTSINGILRKKRVIRKGSDEVIDKLDKAFEVIGTNDVLDVYRTVEWVYLASVYGITKENIDEYVGSSIISRGYMSTTELFKSPWGKSWMDDDVVMHITSDKPYPNININKVFNPDEIDCEDQCEILLPRDTTLELVSYSVMNDTKKGFSKNGTYVLEMRIK